MIAPSADVLLVGAGDLGTEIGLRLAAAGHGAVAVRRRAELVGPPLVGVGGDIAGGLPPLPQFDDAGSGPRLLVICLTAAGRREDAYRATFLDGVDAVLRDVRDRGWTPERALFVSSTGAMGHDPDGDGWVDEEANAPADTTTGRVLDEAEKRFVAALPDSTRGIVVRPSGLYGPGREWFIDQVRGGRLADPGRMTNRIHRDDAAGAVVHLLTATNAPEPLYLLTDDEPAPAAQVAGFIAGELGLSAPVGPVPGSPHASKATRRLRNARLRSTGFAFTYPTYREGYAAVLAGEGRRHP